MCQFLAPLLIGAGGAGAATAGAGAAAATAGAASALTAGQLLTIGGTALSAGGALFQGISGARAARQQAAALDDQRRTEARLTATEDARTRLQFRQATRRQFAELAARGVALDSPSVIALGQTAGEELAFASQAVRSRGAATGRELTAAGTIARSRATSSLLRGTFSAAGSFLNAAPQIFPELLR